MAATTDVEIKTEPPARSSSTRAAEPRLTPWDCGVKLLRRRLDKTANNHTDRDVEAKEDGRDEDSQLGEALVREGAVSDD